MIACRAVLPGSFDPVTRGHLDLVRRAQRLFPSLVVAVLENPAKAPLFSAEERVALLAGELAGLDPAVDVRSFRGLTVALAEEVGASWIVRGVRSPADAGFELPMAHANRCASGGRIETVFLVASPETGFIASRLVREIALAGGDVTAFVTPRVVAALEAKRRQRGAGRGAADG